MVHTFPASINAAPFSFQNSRELPLRPVLPTGRHVLEVKYDEFLPDFLYQVMNLGSLRQSGFSKYYLCRKFTV